MRGKDLDHLLLVRKRGLQVGRRRQVARTALVLRECLVCDVANEVLHEAVVAVLGRAWVGLDGEHLLAHEGLEQRL